MKLELKENMYVRTKKGNIYKFETNNSMAKNGAKKYMVNCSYNIIDILEFGDFVNGYKVVDIIHNNRKLEPSTMAYCEYGSRYIGFYNESIKSVITHEQMEQMEYKVEE